MRVSKIIETLTRRREWLLTQLDAADPGSGRWHRVNQEQRAIEDALPILEMELVHRQVRAAEQEEERFSATRTQPAILAA
jgi:hypothetical protein